MEYKEFLTCVVEYAKEYIGEEGKVSVNHVIKNNGIELDGIVVMQKDRNAAPTIYLNSFYNDYKEGQPVEDIMEQIFKIYEENKDKVMVNTEYFSKYENIKDKVVFKVINYRQNMKLLSSVPYKRYLDLAVVFYCLLEELEEGFATAMIYDTHIKTWDITVEQLYEDAIRNTPVILESSIVKMSDIIKSLFDDKEEFEKFQLTEKESDQCSKVSSDMYILTNQSKINGAACILYEDVLDRFARMMDCNLYILPSSIHEVILLPKKDGVCKDDLCNMVREVNTTGVSKDEILSDHVYEYSREEKRILL